MDTDTSSPSGSTLLLLDTAGQLHSACPASWVGTLEGQPVRCVWAQLESGEQVALVEALPLPLEPAQRLSPRQAEVLTLVALGYTDPEIARVLGIGWGTVRTHVREARERLGARSRAQAVAAAMVRGWLGDRIRSQERCR